MSMQQKLLKTLCLLSISMIADATSMGESKTSVGGPERSAVNFFGVLKTRKGKTYDVENILFDGYYKQIPMYELPEGCQVLEQPKKGKNKEEKSVVQECELTSDPKKFITRDIDFAEVKKITVPDPDKIWIWQKEKGSRKVEYIELVIKHNDSLETTRHYLKEIGRRQLTCIEVIGNKKESAIEEEMKVPYAAIKSLTLKGYRYRDEKNNKSEEESDEKPKKKQGKKRDSE